MIELRFKSVPVERQARKKRSIAFLPTEESTSLQEKTMISMLIADGYAKERRAISMEAHEQAAMHTDEYWNWLECEDEEKLKKLIEEDPRLHLVCLDLSMRDAVDSAKKLRSRSSETYMILVADMAIPPTVYMRPSIGAESLLLRPLDFAQIREVLSEAIGTYAKRYLNADDRKVFVLERKSFRELIEYDRICYFESREKKLFCNTGFEEYSFYGTLDLLQEQLGDAFIRCHRSFLVNKKKVVRVFLSQNLLELEGNIELPLSRSCKPAIKEFLKI